MVCSMQLENVQIGAGDIRILSENGMTYSTAPPCNTEVKLRGANLETDRVLKFNVPDTLIVTNTALANQVLESDAGMLEMKHSNHGDNKMKQCMKRIDADEFVVCIDLEDQYTAQNKFCKVVTRKEMMDKSLSADEIVAVCGTVSLQRWSIKRLLPGE